MESLRSSVTQRLSGNTVGSCVPDVRTPCFVKRHPYNKSACKRLHASSAVQAQEALIEAGQARQGSRLASPAISRRIAICTGISLVVGCSGTPVWADDSGRKVFLDVRFGADPESPIVGRIVIELLDDVKAGAQRFFDLAKGSGGVDYRLSKFDTVVDNYIRDSGARTMSGYRADERSPIPGGDSLQDLEAELASQTRSHDGAGLVSLVVREAKERQVKERLIARDGKFMTVKEVLGEAANGSSFVITRGPAPELDPTNVIVGRVVEGMDVVEKIGHLPINKPRHDDVFFKAGKAIGDKRAVTAERAFNRPLIRVTVAASGVVA